MFFLKVVSSKFFPPATANEVVPLPLPHPHGQANTEDFRGADPRAYLCSGGGGLPAAPLSEWCGLTLLV